MPIPRLAAAFLLALFAVGPAALAQGPFNSNPYPLPPKDHPVATNPVLLPLTESLGIEAAKEKAKQTKRLVMIFWCADEPTDPSWTFCRSSRSLSLRSYIKWHCVAIQCRTLPPALGAAVCRALFEQSQVTPAVILLRDGALEQVIGADAPMMDHGIGA